MRLHAFQIFYLILQLLKIVVFFNKRENTSHTAQLTKLNQTNPVSALHHPVLIIQNLVNALFNNL